MQFAVEEGENCRNRSLNSFITKPKSPDRTSPFLFAKTDESREKEPETARM
jgi:hypothetical protein